MDAYWVNVDFPTKSCTLHAAGCRYEQNKYPTLSKGIRQLKRDGGWLPFNSAAEAEQHCNANFPNLTIKKCGTCKP